MIRRGIASLFSASAIVRNTKHISKFVPTAALLHSPKAAGGGAETFLFQAGYSRSYSLLARKGIRLGFEGEQTPMRRRLPKRGFKNPFSLTFQPVGLGKMAKFINAGLIDSHELITMLKPQISSSPPPNPNFPSLLRHFSSNRNNNNGKGPSSPDFWNFSNEGEDKFDSIFSVDPAEVPGTTKPDPPIGKEESWTSGGGSFFSRVKSTIQEESSVKGGEFGQGNKGIEGEEDWLSSEGFKPWSLGEEEKDIFNFEGVEQQVDVAQEEVPEVDTAEEKMKLEQEKMRLEQEEKALTAAIKGRNRAFGDLILASGITDAMLDSLIALRDFEGVSGLPPLTEIEDMRYEKRNKKSSGGADLERLKQEEAARARVRKVDDKGRAYGTGKRKCSIARVWIQPDGDGKFVVNDKQFDAYFPMLDHRAALLRPLSETKTLGLWDINCTVKGGGVSGQVGAVQLGISRALQNWEPGLRPPLRHGGFLTRDSRIVERKKPGKAKARKSFQWVKR